MSPQHSDLLDVEVIDGVPVARFLRPNLDASNADAVREQLSRLAESTKAPLRLDLGRVTFLGSTALAMLVALNERLRAAGGRLTLEQVDPANFRVLRATGLTQVLDVRKKQVASGV